MGLTKTADVGRFALVDGPAQRMAAFEKRL